MYFRFIFSAASIIDLLTMPTAKFFARMLSHDAAAQYSIYVSIISYNFISFISSSVWLPSNSPSSSYRNNSSSCRSLDLSSQTQIDFSYSWRIRDHPNASHYNSSAHLVPECYEFHLSGSLAPCSYLKLHMPTERVLTRFMDSHFLPLSLSLQVISSSFSSLLSSLFAQ